MENSSAKRFAVVTGASSRIGNELAKQFAQNKVESLQADLIHLNVISPAHWPSEC